MEKERPSLWPALMNSSSSANLISSLKPPIFLKASGLAPMIVPMAKGASNELEISRLRLMTVTMALSAARSLSARSQVVKRSTGWRWTW